MQKYVIQISRLNIDVPLQVIEYVQYLQEKVQKYEGSYQGWSSEPTKLMPWVKFYSLVIYYAWSYMLRAYEFHPFVLCG